MTRIQLLSTTTLEAVDPNLEEISQAYRVRKTSISKPDMEVVSTRQPLQYSPKVRSPPSLNLQPKRSPAGVEPGLPTSTSSTSMASQPRSAGLPPKSTAVVKSADADSHHVNGHQSPREDGVPSDPFHRLQLQVSYNTASLQSQKRGIEQIDANVALLRREMERLFVDVDTLRAELRARPANGRTGAQSSTTDLNELEMITTTISNVASKANEVDSLKMQLELLKRQVKRMEEAEPGSAVSVLPPPQPVPHQQQQQQQHFQQQNYHQQQQQQQQQQRHPRQAVPEPLSSGASASIYRKSPIEPSVLPSQGRAMTSKSSSPHQSVQSLPHHPSSRTSEHSRPLEREHSGGGWTSVNSGAKRTLQNSLDPVGPERTNPLGSPKRTKLTTLELRKAHEPATLSSRSYEPMDIEETELTRRSSYESYHGQGSNPPGHTSYPSTNEQDPDDSWKPESQRNQMLSKGAQASTYNRGRKSIGPPATELSTPEWERPDWSGPQAHVLQDGYYHPITPNSVGRPGRGSIIRRGGGHVGGSGGAMMVGFGQRGDPFAHTKRTRTKPIRNSDGVLIRKDGQPDMRSHSSAANLRKVHLRKDGEWSSVGLSGAEGGTPQSGSLANSVASHDENYTTASPLAHEMDSDDVEDESAVDPQGREQQYLQQRRGHTEVRGHGGEESESPSASAVATAAILAGERTPPTTAKANSGKTSSGVREDSKINGDDVAAATTAVATAVPAVANTSGGRRQSSKSPLAASFTAANASKQQPRPQQQQQQGTGARHQAIMSKMFPHGVDANGEQERERFGYSGGGKNDRDGAGAKNDEADDDDDDDTGRAKEAKAPQAVMISDSKARRTSAGSAAAKAATVATEKQARDGVDMKDDVEVASVAETQQ